MQKEYLVYTKLSDRKIHPFRVWADNAKKAKKVYTDAGIKVTKVILYRSK